MHFWISKLFVYVWKNSIHKSTVITTFNCTSSHVYSQHFPHNHLQVFTVVFFKQVLQNRKHMLLLHLHRAASAIVHTPQVPLHAFWLQMNPVRQKLVNSGGVPDTKLVLQVDEQCWSTSRCSRCFIELWHTLVNGCIYLFDFSMHLFITWKPDQLTYYKHTLVAYRLYVGHVNTKIWSASCDAST